MGVPVVTWRGDRHSAPVGATLLSRVGLDDLVADDIEGYEQAAIALARDPERLAELRAGMRDRMRASPLCDGPGFARDLEQAFRTMWRDWCNERRADGKLAKAD